MALPEDADGRAAMAPPWLGPAIRDTIEMAEYRPPKTTAYSMRSSILIAIPAEPA